jgi:hypothetical protein
MDDAHRCAMAMLDSGTYIERELPNVHMDFIGNHTPAPNACGLLAIPPR